MPAGYKIRGIAPYELRTQPQAVKLMYWSWVVELGIKAKDRDLAMGLDAHGEELRPISAKTRRHRKSEMTPTGKGDPSAPPLTPGRALSRTRSLLAGRAFSTHAEFYWRFDPFTHDMWGRILTYQKEHGRDVFGLSEDSTNRVRQQALKLWAEWKRAGSPHPTELEGRKVLGATPGSAPPVLAPPRTNLTHATLGINTPAVIPGGFTEAELKAAFRATAPARVQNRAGKTYNRLLSHIWGHPGQPTASGGAVAPLTPKPPVVNKKAERAARAEVLWRARQGVGISGLAKRNTEALPWDSDVTIHNYQQGVLVGRNSGIDEIFLGMRGAKLAEETRAAFEDVRNYLRARYGTHVTLYRAEDIVPGTPGKPLSAYALSEGLAREFMFSGRRLSKRRVPIEAIYAAPKMPGRPLEFLVDNKMLESGK